MPATQRDLADHDTVTLDLLQLVVWLLLVAIALLLTSIFV